MNRQRVQQLLGGRPSLALLVPAALAGGVVRADDANGAPVSNQAGEPVSVAARSASRIQHQVAPGLFLPADLLDAHDSKLLRELLLVQGVELDLGAAGRIDGPRFRDIWETLDADETLHQSLDIDLLLRRVQAGVLSLHSAIVFPDDAPSVEDYVEGISRDWRILWLDQDPGYASSQRIEQIPEEAADRAIGVSSRWNMDMVLTRPATAAEIEMVQAYPGDPTAGFASVIVPSDAATEITEADTPAATAAERDAQGAPDSTPAQSTGVTTGTTIDIELDPLATPSPDADLPETAVAATPSVEVNTDGVALPPGVGALGDLTADIPVPGLAPVTPGSIPDIGSGSSNEESRNTTEETSDGLFSIAGDVPEGFELLAGPQSYLVDLFFNGEEIGTTGITFIDGDVVIDDVDALLALLPGILQPEVVREALSLPLPANEHKICYGLDEPAGCGQLVVDVVGVIFNESELTLNIFVASDYQQAQSASRLRYLADPERKNTSILSLQAVASDLQQDETSFDLSARGLHGYGRGNLSAEVDYNTRTDRQRLHEFKLTHHFTDYELIAGTYAYHPGGGLRDINLLGASVATSLKTRVDLEHAFSTELVVYLQRRSIVQLVVDDRVYAAESYAAGNQILNTGNLPDGTYEVEIRILDSQSGSRVERRSYTKSTQIPPRGETVYQYTAGVPLLFSDNHIFPDTTDSAVAGFSIARRLNDQSAYRLGLVQFDSNTLLQGEYTYLGEFISFQFTGSAGTDNTLASALRVGWHKDNTSLSLTAEQFESDVEVGDDPVYEQFYSDDHQQVTFSLSQAYKTFSVGARWNFRENQNEDGSETTRQYALYYRRPILRRRYLKGFFDATYQVDENDERLNLQVKFFVDRGQWSSGLGAEVSIGEDNTDTRGSVNTRWQSDDKARYDWSVGLHADSNELGEAAGAFLTLEHPWYQAGLSSDINLNADSQQQQSSLAFVSANFGADARGIAVGGADFAQAGVIIDVRGEPKGARFDILIDEIKTSTGEIGTRQFIGLRPYEQYRIRLRPQTVLSNGIDAEEYEFTLFPGNVKRIDLEAKQKILLIATLVNEFGELIEDAIVDYSPNPLLIEQGGFFQSEVVPGETIVVKLSTGEQCEFVVPPADGEELVVLDEPLLCKPGGAE